MRDFVLTSEAFTSAHPDKICDQISDAVVDACLSGTPRRGVTAECALASGIVFLSIRSDGRLEFDAAATARRVIASVGYKDTPAPTVMLDTAEHADLAPPKDFSAVRAAHMTTVFGHACDQTPEMMPYPIRSARTMARQIETARTRAELSWMPADAQVQVAVAFADRRPRAITGIAVTLPTGENGIEVDVVEGALRRHVIAPAFEGARIAPDAETRLVINRESGPGGPAGHSGLTGRKTSADGYGGYCRQSASALSGKDPARIDRVGVYAAHHAARAVVAAGLARDCEVQLSYAPGDAGPLGIEVDSFETGDASDETIAARLRETIDFRLGAIMERFALWDLPSRHGGVFYRRLAAHGHLGRADMDLPWDEVTEAARLLA